MTSSQRVSGEEAARRRRRRLLLAGGAVLMVATAVLSFSMPDWWTALAGHRWERDFESGETHLDRSQDTFPEPAFAPQATIEDLTRATTQAVDDLVAAYPETWAPLHVLARWQYSLRNTAEAVRLWERCAQRDPQHAEVYLGIGSVAKESGDYRKAEEMFRKTLALAPGNDAASIALAETCLQQGQLQEAVATLEEYLKTHPISAPAADCLGQSCLQLKAYQKACQALEESLRINPHNRSACYGLARAYASLGQQERSDQYMEKFRDLAARDGDNANAARDRAEVLLTDSPLVRQSAAQTLIDVANVYRDQGCLDKAEGMWRRAAVLDGKNLTCRAELALRYERTNREREALRMCEQLRDLEPGNADHWLDVGVLNGRLGHYDAALAAVAKAVQMAPDKPQYRQAYELIQQGK